MADKPHWPGIASFSTSVMCRPEPHNVKPLFGLVAARAMALLTAARGRVSFVQVGANDGVAADHLNPFIRSGKWHGVLVEPGADAFARLREHYAGVAGLQFVQAAIWTEAGRRPFYLVEGEDVLSSFDLDTIMAHAPKYDDLAGMVRTVEVETETLNGLCDRMGIAAPDVVAIDTEGTDDVVLQSFDVEGRRPSLLLFEHCHLDAARSAAVKQRLESAGYRVIHDRHDALAIADGSLDAGTVEFLAGVVDTARAAGG